MRRTIIATVCLLCLVALSIEVMGQNSTTKEDSDFVSEVVLPVPVGETEYPIASIHTVGHGLEPIRVVLVLWEDGRMIWLKDYDRLTGLTENRIIDGKFYIGEYHETHLTKSQIDTVFDVMNSYGINDVPYRYEDLTLGATRTYVSLSRNNKEFDLALAYPAVEENDPGALFTPGGIIELKPGETREDVIKRQNDAFRRFREVADFTIETLYSLIPSDEAKVKNIGFVSFDFKRRGYTPSPTPDSADAGSQTTK